jgi:hypothetical protein
MEDRGLYAVHIFNLHHEFCQIFGRRDLLALQGNKVIENRCFNGAGRYDSTYLTEPWTLES